MRLVEGWIISVGVCGRRVIWIGVVADYLMMTAAGELWPRLMPLRQKMA